MDANASANTSVHNNANIDVKERVSAKNKSQNKGELKRENEVNTTETWWLKQKCANVCNASATNIIH